MALLLWLSLVWAADPHAEVRGITVSTPTWGWEWGTPKMEQTLEQLASEGANWVAIHPYAGVRKDGSLRYDIDVNDPPDWIAKPIAWAHARGLKVLIKPHLAYWGSGFSWRGDIRFDDPAAAERFHAAYRDWIVKLAQVSRGADAFAVGTELDQTLDHEVEWRHTISAVRQVHPGVLTYAANWDHVDKVPFWDALDCIGVQAYYPLVSREDQDREEDIRAGWARVMKPLHRLSEQTGKPVVFTELGYDEAAHALTRPWESGRGHPERQREALRVALDVVAQDPVVTGAFLWKWFPGELQRGDFRVSREDLREVVRQAWAQRPVSSEAAAQ